MKDPQLSLNQTQKIRLERAFQQLQELSSKFSSHTAVAVADTIPVNYEDGFLKGHGTSEIDGEVISTVCGVVERVNKLVYVRALQARYKPETGDIIVGRVIEIAAKRWKLDINFSQNAVLMLSSMNLPDGLQRRRTAVDELNMRTIFVENDVVCAEVRGFQHDGSLHLQARSHKYGKLEKGQLLKVPPYLVKRRKQHFNHLDRYGIDLVLGCNGYIWVGEHVQVRDDVVEDRGGGGHVAIERRESICRTANAVRVLCSMGFSITVEVVVDTVEMSSSMSVGVHEMLGAEFGVLVAEAEAERRHVLAKRK